MHSLCLKAVLCKLGLWFHVKEQKEAWLNWIYHLISGVQPAYQHSGFVAPQSQAPALLWGRIGYCMSGVGPSILCYLPKSPNGQHLETPVRCLKGGLWSQSQKLHEFGPIRPLLSTSDKVKVPACVRQRWNIQSGNSLGGGGTNSGMVDLSSRRITKNLLLAKALTGNRAAKHILCVTYMWKAWGGDLLTVLGFWCFCLFF